MIHAEIIRHLVEAQEALDRAAFVAAGRDRVIFTTIVKAKEAVVDVTASMLRLGAAANPEK